MNFLRIGAKSHNFKASHAECGAILRIGGFMGIIIAGTHSGCGKTTVTCAVLQALVNKGLRAASFKCGPDYIDPMFHERVIGTAAYNLDGYFCGEDTLRYLYSTHSREADISIVEGVMGFYDGAVGGEGSAYELARSLELPAVLVLDCKGAGESVGAVMRGFLSYKTPNTIRGFIFNRLSEKMVPRIRGICAELGTEFLGYLPIVRDCVIESRHLGLITASEIPELREKLAVLADYAEKFIDIERLVKLADCPSPEGKAPGLPSLDLSSTPVNAGCGNPPINAGCGNPPTNTGCGNPPANAGGGKPPVIAVARDAAFCFIYRDNIELLERLGCDIRYFSPISDSALPEGTRGLILCGGYPELYAKQLSENTNMRENIRSAIAAGMPAIAECGGFLYLHRTLETADGERFPMVGAVDGEAFKTDRLQRFGYIELTALRDNLLCQKREVFRSHEFHYWDSTCPGDAFTAVKPDGTRWLCGISTDTLYAGFPHLYFYSYPEMGVNFVKKCANCFNFMHTF